MLNPRKRDQLFWMTTWIALVPAQYRLIRRLATHPGQVVTHTQLYHALTADKVVVEPGQIAWHISKIKALAHALSGHELPIENIHGRGYILNLPEMSIILVPEATDETT